VRDLIKENREFLKDTLRLKYDFRQTDQNRGVKAPPIQKPLKDGRQMIELPKEKLSEPSGNMDLVSAIRYRESKRKYRLESLALDELSFLLWATQGLRSILHNGHAFRVVPSAGCRRHWGRVLPGKPELMAKKSSQSIYRRWGRSDHGHRL